VLFQGIEKVFQGIIDTGKKGYHSNQIYAHKVVLWRPEPGQSVLQKGDYCWTFSFQLPENIPPSIFFEEWLFVFYQARGYVEPLEPKKSSSSSSKIISTPFLFDLWGTSENQWGSHLAASLPSSASQNWDKGEIHVNGFTKRADWYMGELVTIFLKISNETNKSISIKVDLFQDIKIHGPSYKQEFESIKLLTEEFDEVKVEKGVSDQMRVLDIQMPEAENDEGVYILPSTDSLGMKLFTVTHHLRVRLKIPHTKDRSVIIPVKVRDPVIDRRALQLQEMIERQGSAS